MTWLMALLLVSVVAVLALATMIQVAEDISVDERARRVHVREAYDGTLAVDIESDVHLAVLGPDVSSKQTAPVSASR